MKLNPLVAIAIIALNEEKTLPLLLSDINMQTYPHDRMLVVLVDSLSQDGTKRKMWEYAKHNDVLDVICVENPRVIQACGWNTAFDVINSYSESVDIVIRVDAHIRLNKDFVEKNVECLLNGHNVCGGSVVNRPAGNCLWQRLLCSADNAVFGAGIASLRKKESSKISLYNPAYRKEVIDRVGRFNERLKRTEDNEYNYRIRGAGYRFCYDPCIQSLHISRGTLSSLLKQKYGNGEWIGRTLFISPKCLEIYHFIPAAFVGGIVLTSVLAALGVCFPAVIMWSLYMLLMISSAIIEFIRVDRNVLLVLMPLIVLLIHISYGLGTFRGLAAELLAGKRNDNA